MEFQYKGLRGRLERLTPSPEEIDRQLQRLEGQDCSEFSPEELRQGVARALQAHYDHQALEELEDRLIRQAAATLDYAPSQAEIEQSVQEQLELLRNQLAQKGLSLAAYCDFSGRSEAQLQEDLRPDALQTLRIRRAIDRIVALEGLTVSPGELDQARQELLRAYRVQGAELSAQDAAALEEGLRQGQLQRKALALLRQYAILEEA